MNRETKNRYALEAKMRWTKTMTWGFALVAALSIPVAPAAGQTDVEARRAAELAEAARTRGIGARLAGREEFAAQRELALAARSARHERVAHAVAVGKHTAEASLAAEELLAAEQVRAARALAGMERSTEHRDAPEPWLQEDPGSALYRTAREELNGRNYSDAAIAFARLRAEYPNSGYVADSYYWQAFALSREGSRRQLQQAAELLEMQRRQHPSAGTLADARELMVRIEARLARAGDRSAAAAIAQQANDPCSEEAEVRMAALSALLNMNSERAVPILQEVLRSRDACSVELRRRAVFLVSQKMTPETVDILLDLAHRNPDPDPEVREQAIFWLHQVQTPEALAALESILAESDDAEMQERAIFAISQRGNDERAVAVLEQYARRNDVDPDLRRNAIFWVAQHPASGGARFLIELYNTLDDPELREMAIHGIAQAGTDEAREWLVERALDTSETTEMRTQALFWAGQIGGVDAEALRGIYRTVEDREMKEQVIFVASQRTDKEIVDFLMEVARDEDDPELRRIAVFWLGQSKDPRVAEFLLTIIRR